MPKRLLILRHAKSSWEESALPDHERKLNERGKSDARSVGKLLRLSSRVPDLIISSTARRARKTAQRVARVCRYRGTVLLYPELYSAPADRILDVLRDVPGNPNTLLIVGHNPGLEEFTSQLVGQTLVMPTAALADLQVSLERWPELAFGHAATLNELWTPKADEPTVST